MPRPPEYRVKRIRQPSDTEIRNSVVHAAAGLRFTFSVYVGDADANLKAQRRRLVRGGDPDSASNVRQAAWLVAVLVAHEVFVRAPARLAALQAGKTR